ncbi:Putative fluoride ion transporter CrcB [Candidatus Lokiarchaeum ossiferum]|uniref:Fluoride-specific ion channel n=1 Tax=Candidatus Lokiarchaeum ossiferum TaxID=2951803 RepID=A0ABY6HVM7_9ARCH|nr:Putative fluoride ion transporter CrcB [Candidatus Lokiarchaeum sp. B-35]
MILMKSNQQIKIFSGFLIIIFRGLGGAMGAILRYLVWLRIETNYSNQTYWGSIIVNVVGAFLAGLSLNILYCTKGRFTNILRGFRHGFISGFTVFNWFVFDLYSLFISGHVFTACIIIVLCLMVNTILYEIGGSIGRKISPTKPDLTKRSDSREIPWEGER